MAYVLLQFAYCVVMNNEQLVPEIVAVNELLCAPETMWYIKNAICFKFKPGKAQVFLLTFKV